MAGSQRTSYFVGRHAHIALSILTLLVLQQSHQFSDLGLQGSDLPFKFRITLQGSVELLLLTIEFSNLLLETVNVLSGTLSDDALCFSIIRTLALKLRCRQCADASSAYPGILVPLGHTASAGVFADRLALTRSGALCRRGIGGIHGLFTRA